MSDELKFTIGILVNIVGAVTTNLGTVLMKYHASVKQEKGPYLKIGLTMFAVGSILTFASFALAPQSLLAGISSVQFVSNLFFAHYFLGAPINTMSITGTLVIIVAIVLLVIGAVKSAEIDSVDEMFSEYYFTWEHVAFLACLAAVLSVIGFSFWMRTGVPVFWKRRSPITKRLQWELSLPRSQGRSSRFLVPLSYSFVAAAIGAQSVVSGKVLSIILSKSFSDPSQLYQPRTFLVIFLWLGTAVFWVIHLNRALRIFPGAFVVPLTQVCWTLSTMLSGGIVFQEFQRMEAWQLTIFCCATVILFFGVFLLAPRTQRDPVSTPDEIAPALERESSSITDDAPPPPMPLANARTTSNRVEMPSQRTMSRLMSAFTIDAATEVRREGGEEGAGMNFILASGGDGLQYDMRPTSLGRTVSVVIETGNIDHMEETFADPPYLRFRRWINGKKQIRAARKAAKKGGPAPTPTTDNSESSDELGKPKETDGDSSVSAAVVAPPVGLGLKPPTPKKPPTPGGGGSLPVLPEEVDVELGEAEASMDVEQRR